MTARESPFSAAARRQSSSVDRPQAVPAHRAAAGAEHLEGYVERVNIYGDWGRATVWTTDRKTVTVVGAVTKELKEGMDYAFTGRMEEHQKFAPQFKAQSVTPVIKANPNAVVRYLKANFDGVGEKTAAKFVKAVIDAGGPQALEELRQRLLQSPWLVAEEITASGRQASYSSEQKEATIAGFIQRDLSTRLGGMDGMRENVIKALAGWCAHRLHGPKGRPAEDDEDNGLEDGLGGRPGAARDPGGPAGPAAEFPKDPVASAWAMLSRNPYEPIAEVPGYGFTLADTIGRLVNIPLDAPQRLAALVAHALREHSERNGHVYLTREQLDRSIAKIDPRVDVEAAIAQAVADETIVEDTAKLPANAQALSALAVGGDDQGEVSEDFFGDDALDALLVGGHGDSQAAGVDQRRYYAPALLRAERELAVRVAQMLMPSEPMLPGASIHKGSPAEKRLREGIRAAARTIFPKGLDVSQEDALASIVSSPVRLHTLTAGPGCGKTALMEVLVKLLPQAHFQFCAPTGMAAKVLSNRLRKLGHKASTIHSLLQGSADEGFRVGPENPLYGDVLVVDESSMPDVVLANAVFAAVNSGMHVIMLGDPRQLPSIQPGQVLTDLLRIPEIDHNRLTVTHRNSGGILDVVNEIGEGRLDPSDRESVVFSHGLESAEQDFHAVMGVYLQSVAQEGIENVMLMFPRRQGKLDEPGWNTTYGNAILRAVVNPNAPRVPGTTFSVEDRVIIRDNMTIEQPSREELQGVKPKGDAEPENRKTVSVVNGDTGTIKGFTLDRKDTRNNGAKWIELDLDDGRRLQFPGSAVSALSHAYAKTVHSAQGSEYQVGIIVVTPGSPAFMNRNMLFTGASRVKKKLYMFGEDRVLVKVSQTPLPPRNSALDRRIRAEIEADDEAPAESPSSQSNRGQRHAEV